MPDKSYYLTTALHYVNDEPHLGHAYETILGDVLCRYNRLIGRDVRFLTGVDEHGKKIVEAAAKSGRTPKEHCDLMAERFRSIWKTLNIEPDIFFRTTDQKHQDFVRKTLDELNAKGEIYADDYSGWYCTPDERFWTEKDLVDGNCPSCGRTVEHLTEKNYFFRMGKYREWLIEWIDTHPDFIKPETRKNEILGFLRQPLGDLCISRPASRVPWGIPLPFDKDYVTYVWFDALLNYLSATRIGISEGFKDNDWPADLHLIGKDIVTTHAVYWPIMLHAAGYEPPKTIFAHGWWTVDGGKMSKSVGNVIKPLQLSDKYGADAFRYVVMREMTPGQDASFSEDLFIRRYNSELANDLGNLYNRLSRLWNNGKFNPIGLDFPTPESVPAELRSNLDSLLPKVTEAIDNIDPPSAIGAIGEVVRGLNRYLEQEKPWERIKTDVQAVRPVVSWSLSALYRVAYFLAPVMPVKMNDLRKAIATEGKISPVDNITLFPRIDLKSDPVKVGNSEPSIEKKPKFAESDGLISIEDFGRIDLRVGVVISAKRLEGSDKLLVLQVDIGGTQRQIVAGIAQSYEPETLVGQQVVVVANLKPAMLRGAKSEGMLLAATSGAKHFIVSPLGIVASGTKVK